MKTFILSIVLWVTGPTVPSLNMQIHPDGSATVTGRYTGERLVVPAAEIWWSKDSTVVAFYGHEYQLQR